MWRNPLIGPLVPGDERFPDMSQPYDGELLRSSGRSRRHRHSRHGRRVRGLLGPTYETPAEVRMLERLGTDAVGMSTVPEV